METLEQIAETTSEFVASFDGYDVTAKVGTSKIVVAILGMIVLFVAIIAVCILIKMKHSGGGFCLLWGICVYLLFFYFAISAIISLLFNYTPLKKCVDTSTGLNLVTNKGIFVLVYTLVAGLIPMIGRIATKYAFSYKNKPFAHNLAFGQGIACSFGIFSMSTLLQMISSMMLINKEGMEKLVEGATRQEEVNAVLQTATTLVNLKVYNIIILVVLTVALIVYQIAITVPIYGILQKKVKGYWYAIIFGSYLAIEALQRMTDYGIINDIVQFFGTIAVMAPVIVFCIKIYKENYMVIPEDKDKTPPANPGDKGVTPHKIPKFENLSNL